MSNFRALLFYVHMTTYNWVNCKCPWVITVYFYRLIWFHIWRHFCTSLSVGLYNSGQPVTSARKYCKNNPCHKLYGFTPEGSTHHYTLLHTPTIIHTKTLLHQHVTCERKYCPRQNCHILQYYTHSRFIRHHPLLNTNQKYIPSSWIILLLIKLSTCWFNPTCKSYHFPLGWIRNKLIQPKIWVGTFPFLLL